MRHRVISDEDLIKHGLDPKQFERCILWWDGVFIKNIYERLSDKKVAKENEEEFYDNMYDAICDVDFSGVNEHIDDVIQEYINGEEADSKRTEYENYWGTIREKYEKAEGIEERFLDKIDEITTRDNMETIEWCSSCGGEVTLPAKLEQMVCPECGERIYPCSTCPVKNKHCWGELCPMNFVK